MPQVICSNGHTHRWANRRGARLAGARCPNCGEPVKRVAWRLCKECLGTQEFLLPLGATHCPVGHALPAKAKRRMWVRAARRYALKHLGPLGWADSDYWLPEHMKPTIPTLQYAVLLLSAPAVHQVPSREEIAQGTILGRGRTFEDAFADARANHPESFLPQKGARK